MDEKRDISEGFSQATEAIEKNSFITKLKHFNILSWIGIVLTIFFIICSFINITNLTWWIMLPIFIISFIALFKQKKNVVGLEKTFVITFLWILIAMLFIRDAFLSEKLMHIYNFSDNVKELKAFF